MSHVFSWLCRYIENERKEHYLYKYIYCLGCAMSDALSSLVSMFVIVGAKLPDLDLAVLSCADGRVGGLAGLVDS